MSAQPFNETEFTPRTFANILADARTVKPDQLDIVSALVNECADLGPIEQNTVMRAIKDATGIPLGTLKAQLTATREDKPEPDHLELARAVIAAKGEDNIICAEAHVWGWQGSGVWVIPMRIDHDPCAHWRMPMDMIRHG